MTDLRPEDLGSAQACTLRPSFRWHIAVLGALISAVLGFVAATEHGPGAIVFGFVSVTIAVVVFTVGRREAALLQNYLSVFGKVTAVKRSRRGSDIQYRFLALDGKVYEGEACLSPVRSKHEGETIVVLYRPLEPASNLPLAGFMFYSFASMGCDARNVEGKSL